MTSSLPPYSNNIVSYTIPKKTDGISELSFKRRTDSHPTSLVVSKTEITKHECYPFKLTVDYVETKNSSPIWSLTINDYNLDHEKQTLSGAKEISVVTLGSDKYSITVQKANELRTIIIDTANKESLTVSELIEVAKILPFKEFKKPRAIFVSEKDIFAFYDLSTLLYASTDEPRFKKVTIEDRFTSEYDPNHHTFLISLQEGHSAAQMTVTTCFTDQGLLLDSVFFRSKYLNIISV